MDYDASTGEGTVLSRIRMLLDEELDPELLCLGNRLPGREAIVSFR